MTQATLMKDAGERFIFGKYLMTTIFIFILEMDFFQNTLVCALNITKRIVQSIDCLSQAFFLAGLPREQFPNNLNSKAKIVMESFQEWSRSHISY